jgi:hypothetical protein
VLTLINTSNVNTSIVSSSGPNVVTLNEDDSKKIGEELRRANLPIVPLNSYSFIHGIQDPVEKMSD